MREAKRTHPLLPLPRGPTGLAAEKAEKAASPWHPSRDRLDPRNAGWRTILPGVCGRDTILSGDMPYGAVMFNIVISFPY